MRRIVIIGTSGSGKTTLAGQLAEDLGLTHIELDALFHQPNWQPTPPAQFQQKLQAAMDNADQETDGWTVCGNYETPSDRIHQRAADTVVWLDMSRSLLMWRVVRRTVSRAVKRTELWNGNREPLTNFYKWDPEENIIRWTWTKFHPYRRHFATSMIDGTWSHATVYRLCSPAEVADFRSQASAMD